jgi:RimJ/RimL family protein N-acetyltransferase
LLLEPLTRKHAAALFPILTDSRIYRHFEGQPPESVDRLRETYSQLESRRSPDGRDLWLNWAVRLAPAGEYVGRVEATVYGDGTAEIGYIIAPDQGGQGYGTEAVSRMVDYLSGSGLAGVRRVKAQIDPANVASVRLVEKLGFIPADSEGPDVTYVLLLDQ